MRRATQCTARARPPATQMRRPTRCFTTAVQPLRAHARSHCHLDPAIRLAALTQEYQRIWGSDPLPSPQAAIRRELQANQQPFDDYYRRADSHPEDPVFVLKRRLALCGFQRALIKMPKLYWVAQPGTENPATMFVRLPDDRQHRQFVLVFTSMLQYQTFSANVAMPNHSVEEADGDSLGGIIQPLKAVQRMHLIVDPSPNFLSHRGMFSGDDFQSFNLQQSSLHVAENLKSGWLPERDTFLESHVFSYLTTASGVPHISVSEATGPVLPVFISDVHFDIMRHTLGPTFVPKHQRYSALLDTVRSLPQVQGVILDGLPASSVWTTVASEEVKGDMRLAYMGRKF